MRTTIILLCLCSPAFALSGQRQAAYHHGRTNQSQYNSAWSAFSSANRLREDLAKSRRARDQRISAKWRYKQRMKELRRAEEEGKLNFTMFQLQMALLLGVK